MICMTFKVIKPNTIAPIMDFFPFILDPTKAKIAEIINKTKYKKAIMVIANQNMLENKA